MVNDMLLLVKVDYGLLVFSCQVLDLGVEVDLLLEFYQLLVEDCDICLLCEGSLSLFGDCGMLWWVLVNLLDNVLCFIVDGGEICICFGD